MRGGSAESEKIEFALEQLHTNIEPGLSATQVLPHVNTSYDYDDIFGGKHQGDVISLCLCPGHTERQGRHIS